MSARTTTRIAAAGAAGAVLAMLAGTPALAASDGSRSNGVKVVNTETVQVYTSPTGEVQTKRIYEQLALSGNGTVKLANPVSTDALRNLDGFRGFTVKNGKMITTTTVDGQSNLRTVSNFDGKLPLDVSVAYKLDGKNVDPGDVVGAHGHLEVTYTVKNVTAEPQQVTFDDGTGRMITRTVQVPIPMVGTLDTTAPSSFKNVRSVAANMGGDGQGGTQLSFTMTLFPPIGTDTAVFGYTADITDGVVPRAVVSALPVNPLQSPIFKSGAASYKSGADSGIELTQGAGLIDTNLLKLRDGAAKLLSGIIQLRDGAQQLQAGLAGQAVPGSEKLAAGAGQLDAGLGKLDAGGQQLASGTGQAASGSNQLAAGSKKLAGGAGQLADGQHALEAGLKTLYDGVQSLPESVKAELVKNPDYQSALLALQLVIAGIGNSTDVTNPATGLPNTLLGGLNAIELGLTKQVQPGLAQILAGIPGSKTKLQCAAAIVGAVAGGPPAPNACTGGAPLVASSDPTTRAVLQSVASGLGTSAGDLDTLAAALTEISNAIDQQFVPGLDKIKFGLSNPAADPAKCAQNLLDPAKKCGIKQVAQALLAGIPVLVDTLTQNISSQLLAGIGQPTKGCNPSATLRCGAAALSSGVDQLEAGSSQLAAGAGKLSSGLGQIDSGANQLSNGLGQAKDGSGQLADGAQQLATGLGTAANGSGQLADGLGQAAKGAPQIVDGAGRLSKEGTKKLVQAGKNTAQSYGESYAVFKAGAQRATTQDMAYGAPAGAMGLTAYNYVITGDDGETGRNWTRGIAGLALLGAGAAAFALRRRFV